MRIVVVLLLGLGFAGVADAAESETSCVFCHGNPDMFEGSDLELVEHFGAGVHAEIGLSCQDCHGGNPDPALAEEMDLAMDPGFMANPYLGAPDRTDIPEFCARCHSDPTFMKRFAASPRVDQLTEYWTSNHGKALLTGDTHVATCIDCHGVHGILAITDPKSPVYPTRVAETCRGCHADPEHMQGYTAPDGSPLPVDQYDRWSRSVHAAAMFEKEDLTAPTCNDCHGNHGAAPPGLETVAFVCGQCHGRESELFRESPKLEGFVEHNELLADFREEGCRGCHEAPEPQSRLFMHSFSECATCHDNHAVVRPTVALLGSLPETPCAFCHESVDPIFDTVEEPARILEHYTELRNSLLASADSLGLSGDERFDWMVDRALALPTHTRPTDDDQDGPPPLRPQFARLFEKFRIGKTTYDYFDPGTQQEVRAGVVQCTRCHAAEPDLAESGVGFATAEDFLNRMRQLTTMTARAERIILAAQRGGVEVRDGLLELDKAVDSQIELEVLVHSFVTGDSSAFGKKHAEGIAHANAALLAGEEGLREFRQRRRGLYVSLGAIALALLALGILIRKMSGDAMVPVPDAE
jgi:hypothetical protein